jgi:hypothetical protein
MGWAAGVQFLMGQAIFSHDVLTGYGVHPAYPVDTARSFLGFKEAAA